MSRRFASALMVAIVLISLSPAAAAARPKATPDEAAYQRYAKAKAAGAACVRSHGLTVVGPVLDDDGSVVYSIRSEGELAVESIEHARDCSRRHEAAAERAWSDRLRAIADERGVESAIAAQRSAARGTSTLRALGCATPSTWSNSSFHWSFSLGQTIRYCPDNTIPSVRVDRDNYTTVSFADTVDYWARTKVDIGSLTLIYYSDFHAGNSWTPLVSRTVPMDRTIVSGHRYCSDWMNWGPYGSWTSGPCRTL